MSPPPVLRSLVFTLLLALLGGFEGPIATADESPEANEAIRQAVEARDRGLAAIAGSSAAAAAFAESAVAWQEAIAAGADGADAWFNLGNARLRGGRIGPAIVAYRRAERLDPTNDDIAANLAEARRRVDRPIQADATDLDFVGVATWWHVLAPRTRLWLALIGWIGFWVLLDRRRSGNGSRSESEAAIATWRIGLTGTLAVAVIAAASLAADRLLPTWRPGGVLIHPDVVLRSGNGTGFEPAIEESLAEGVEFVILEERPGWWRIRLPDGTVGWISRDDGEAIRGPVGG